MYAGREVYPNAPLEFVAAEIRFTFVPALARNEARETFSAALRDITPVPRLEKFHTFGIGSSGHKTQGEEERFRILNRDSTTSVTLEPQRVIVETTRYSSFDDFRTIVDRVIQALSTDHDIAGIERIGLRYVDEIRVPAAVTTARDWSGWINDDLLAALRIRPTDAVETTQSIIQYATGVDRHLRFRFGSIQGPSIIGNEPLKKRVIHEPGAYFLLDMDSFWEAAEQTPPFEAKSVMSTLDSLHLPTGETFTASITEKLKIEVLRRGNRDE